jgi:hypothetical protein
VSCGVVGGAGVRDPTDHGRGGAGAIELKQRTRESGSHYPNHNAESSDCCGRGRGARGGVNKGPTCCTGKPH